MSFFDTIQNEDLTPSVSTKVKALDTGIYKGVIKGIYLEEFNTKKGTGRKVNILTELQVDGVVRKEQFEMLVGLGSANYKTPLEVIESMFQLVKGQSFKDSANLFSKKIFNVYNKFLKGASKYENVERDGSTALNDVEMYFAVMKKEDYQRTGVTTRDITGADVVKYELTTLKDESNTLANVFNINKFSWKEVMLKASSPVEYDLWLKENEGSVIPPKGEPVFEPVKDSTGNFVKEGNKLKFKKINEDSDIPF